MICATLLLGALAGLAAAQFPPAPEGVKVISSKFHENVTISFKEASGHYFIRNPSTTEL